MRLVLLALLVLQSVAAFAIKPVATYWARPDTLGLKYQSLTLTTPDRMHLAAWLIEPTAAAPSQHTTIVVAGGDAGNMSGNIFTAATLAGAGYRVLLFDYRGFGHSDAFAINQDYLYYPEFATDTRAALAEARRRSPGQRVGLMGFSMGSLVGSEAAATTRCDFFVTVAYVASIQHVVTYYQRVRPERPTILPADAATYGRVAPKVNCPWLFIGGTEDQATTLADTLVVAQAAKRRQRRVVLPIPGNHPQSMGAFVEDETAPRCLAALRQLLASPAAGSKG
ncbi:alpha/beta hydrolase [Hymenobacter ginsengisoli]|uniref:Alpha/beta hydrolase n=1 Tax=Hymenobacter ginsengisoli TaxID=1051626 RepID=A0ABP8QKP8_9BACT|nr:MULTISPECIES: alpha/beta fold hydrolase [unclassified Hymenobacter]MBO2031178.1 alpha/beta fold hydrolase [Hymenobacter sp. BT559]